MVNGSPDFWWLEEATWQVHGKCRRYPQEWFFGEEHGEGLKRHRPTLTSVEVRRAKAICAVCPVLQDCYDHAMLNDEDYGVWGGTTRRDRQRIREGKPATTKFSTTSLS